MSSIIVKGMKMPENCNKCPIESLGLYDSRVGFADGFYKCAFLNQSVKDVMYHGRLSDCPLVDLGKHGRLIDVDAFKADYGMKDDCEDCEKEMRGKAKACMYDYIYSKMDFCGWIDDADVVIEAEDET